MLVLSLFIGILSLIYTDIYTEEVNEGFCDAKKQSCDIPNTEDKFMFYAVNAPEGFNLRRDVYMRFAIMLAEAKKKGKTNWKLVLPPWYKLYHWKSASSLAEPTSWSAFFDVDSLNEFAPVIEYNELVTELPKKSLALDRIYLLQNFDDAFEDGTFTEKWEITSNCYYDKRSIEYKYTSAKEIICVKFQGKISKLWEIISLHPNDKYVMFVHGEIPLHDNYGSKTYWDCRKSMKFNKKLIKWAVKYIYKNFDCIEECTSYLSVHWRRQDFAHARHKDVPSIKGTAKQIDKAVKRNNLNITKVFVATDATQSEIKQLENELKHYGFTAHFYLPSKSEIDEFHDGGIAIIEQIICSHAAYFIGTHESTFSFRIQEEREILGLESETTFNRLCPDTGRCEKPSQWTIVQ